MNTPSSFYSAGPSMESGILIIDEEHTQRAMFIALSQFGVPRSWKARNEKAFAETISNMEPPPLFNRQSTLILPNLNRSLLHTPHYAFLVRNMEPSKKLRQQIGLVHFWVSTELYLKSEEHAFDQKLKVWASNLTSQHYQEHFEAEAVAKKKLSDESFKNINQTAEYNYKEGGRIFADRLWVSRNMHFLA